MRGPRPHDERAERGERGLTTRGFLGGRCSFLYGSTGLGGTIPTELGTCAALESLYVQPVTLLSPPAGQCASPRVLHADEGVGLGVAAAAN